MDIVETSVFTRQICELMEDREYGELQAELVARPDSGKVIPGGGGIRKLRWAGKGRGKRGGARIIYYWFAGPRKLLMLFAYPKTMQADLTRKQLQTLRHIVKEEFQ
jgi:hypothetical protein